MSTLTLTDAEEKLIEYVLDGKTADFTDVSADIASIKIRSEIIRRLLIGLPLPIKNGQETSLICHKIVSSGLRIKSVFIEGILDLSDCYGQDGHGCAPLLLENCILSGEGEDRYDDPSLRPMPSLDAKHSRLSRLSLKNCFAGFIDLADAELGGDLELDGLRSLNDGGQCRIEAEGIRIDGSVKASDVKLRLKQRKFEKIESSSADYALNLKGAEISGNVDLRPHFVADGGINISNAHIKGDLWADGAHLIAQDNQALRGQFAQVDGVVGLTCLHTRFTTGSSRKSVEKELNDERFIAEGAVVLMAAKLGAISMRGALFRRKPNEKDNVFTCTLSEIKQTVDLSPWTNRFVPQNFSNLPFESDYEVAFSGAKILGSFIAQDAKFNAASGDLAFNGINMEIQGELILDGIQGHSILLNGAKIAQNLYLNLVNAISLNAQNMRVGGNAKWNGTLLGTGSLQGTSIDGQLAVRLTLSQDKESRPEVILDDTRINRDLKVSNIEILQNNRLNWAEYSSLSIKKTKLSCYKNWEFCDAVFETGERFFKGFAALSFVLNRTENILFLDGSYPAIEVINKKTNLYLKNEKQVSDYVKFFYAFFWNDEGASHIVESYAEISTLIDEITPIPVEVKKIKIKRNSSGKYWTVRAAIVNAGRLYKILSHVYMDGYVEEVLREELIVLPGKPRTKCVTPIRLTRNSTLSTDSFPLPPFETSGDWNKLSDEKVQKLQPKIRRWIEANTPLKPKPLISLKGTRAGTLEDNHGQNWGDGVILDLEGLVYDSFEASEILFDNNSADSTTVSLGGLWIRIRKKGISLDTINQWRKHRKNVKKNFSWKWRLRWLTKQYKNIYPTSNEYKAQPYEQLSKVFRMQGSDDFATKILLEKLRAHRRASYPHWGLGRLGNWLTEVLFGYGIYVKRVVVTFFIFLAIGSYGVCLANYGHLRWLPVESDYIPIVPFITIPRSVLIEDALPVMPVALTHDTGGILTAEESVVLSTDGNMVKEIRCGNQINPVFYALDTMIPLLDIRQESRCSISTESDAWLWRCAKNLYAVFGWVVTSALLLTLSGFVRRRVER